MIWLYSCRKSKLQCNWRQHYPWLWRQSHQGSTTATHSWPVYHSPL